MVHVSYISSFAMSLVGSLLLEAGTVPALYTRTAAQYRYGYVALREEPL